MKVFKLQIKKNSYSNDVISKITIAPTIEKALDNGRRYAKKNYYSSAEIRVIEMIMDVDIYYR